MIEFHCEGCGDHVYSYGHDAVPATQLCTVCAWLCEHVPDPVEMMDLRQTMGLMPPRIT